MTGSSFAFYFYFINFVFSMYALKFVSGKRCDVHNVHNSNACGLNERCVQTSDSDIGTCKCLISYVRKSDTCEPLPKELVTPTPASHVSPSSSPPVSSTGFSIGMWLLLPGIIVAVAGVMVYFSRQHTWMDGLYRFRVRHYNNVVIGNQPDEEDDDDPPIA